MANNKPISRSYWIWLLCVILLTGAAVLSYRWWGPRISRAAGGFFQPYLKLVHTGNSVLSDQTLLLHDRITLPERSSPCGAITPIWKAAAVWRWLCWKKTTASAII